MPCFVSSPAGELCEFNQAAKAAFETPERVFATLIAVESELNPAGGSFEISLEGFLMSVRYACVLDQYFWFVSQQRTVAALEAQIESLKKPQKQLLQTLQNMVSTAKGYAELIAVMLEENQLVAGERLAAVRRYEQYVNDHLLDMEALLEQASDSQFLMNARFDVQANVAVLIFLSNPVRGELLTELFKSQGMTTRLATSGAEAAALLAAHVASTRLLVTDEPIKAIGEWREQNPEAALICCGSRDFGQAMVDFGDRGCRLSDDPLDINEMLKAAIDLLNA